MWQLWLHGPPYTMNNLSGCLGDNMCKNPVNESSEIMEEDKKEWTIGLMFC